MPEPTETLAEVKRSDDDEKTQIFSKPKPKPSPKQGINKTKVTSQKTNPPKEKPTLIVGLADKKGKNLANSDKETSILKRKIRRNLMYYLYFSFIILSILTNHSSFSYTITVEWEHGREIKRYWMLDSQLLYHSLVNAHRL